MTFRALLESNANEAGLDKGKSGASTGMRRFLSFF
jgi:hypothetical protein